MITQVFDIDRSFANDPRVQHEWLETNGLGGWASSTISGCNTRRYHGLLVASTQPPTGRHVMLSKLEETITTGQNRHELSTNNYGNAIHPQGWNYIKSFSRLLFPQLVYRAGDIEVRKSVLMLHGENTLLIKYEVLHAQDPFVIELTPLVAARGYHELKKAFGNVFDVSAENEQMRIKSFNDLPDLIIRVQDGNSCIQPDWYYNFHYQHEQQRGLDYNEDLFSPGKITRVCNSGEVFFVCVTTENKVVRDVEDRFDAEVMRREELVREETDPATRQLLLSADQFIVTRAVESTNDGATIIAGYHWFTDWGRDTMVALPGLCLATGRFEDARKILLAFSRSVDRGMLPNRFQDNGDKPEYNNVDGTLLYFIAIREYLQATDDMTFVLSELLPVLRTIIDWHYRGTRFNIHVDDDGLLYAGEQGFQLTWMDARIGDWVVTPRMGKPIEIQALWYNALKIFSDLLVANNEPEGAAEITSRAERTKKNFIRKFWYDEGKYLFDVINDHEPPDSSILPNQLFAISLPYTLVEGDKATSVFETVHRHLYTNRGLRSLSPADSKYIGTYAGDSWHRDSSYHQGTVWSWLVGPYIDALYKCYDNNIAAERSQRVVKSILEHLQETGLGTISEIFDGNEPHTSNGCIAQAWSVGELLRVIKKYSLLQHSKPTFSLEHSSLVIK